MAADTTLGAGTRPKHSYQNQARPTSGVAPKEADLASAQPLSANKDPKKSDFSQILEGKKPDLAASEAPKKPRMAKDPGALHPNPTHPKEASKKLPKQEGSLKEPDQRPSSKPSSPKKDLATKPSAKMAASSKTDPGRTVDESSEAPKKISSKDDEPSGPKDPTLNTKNPPVAQATEQMEVPGAMLVQSQSSELGLGSLKSAAKIVKNDLLANPILALLRGDLSQINPQELPALIAGNGFIRKALSEADLGAFFDQKTSLNCLLSDLEVSGAVIDKLQLNGVDLSLVGTPFQLLKAIGVDAQQVRAEVEILRDNLSLGSIEGYLQRAYAQTKNGLQAQTRDPALMPTPGQAAGSSLDQNSAPALLSQPPGPWQPTIAGDQVVVASKLTPEVSSKGLVKSDSGLARPAPNLSAERADDHSQPIDAPALLGLAGLMGGVQAPLQGVQSLQAGVQPSQNEVQLRPFMQRASINQSINIEPPGIAQVEPLAQPLFSASAQLLGMQEGATRLPRASFDHWFEIGQKMNAPLFNGDQVPSNVEKASFADEPKVAAPAQFATGDLLEATRSSGVEVKGQGEFLGKDLGLESPRSSIQLGSTQSRAETPVFERRVDPLAQQKPGETGRDFMGDWLNGSQALEGYGAKNLAQTASPLGQGGIANKGQAFIANNSAMPANLATFDPAALRIGAGGGLIQPSLAREQGGFEQGLEISREDDQGVAATDSNAYRPQSADLLLQKMDSSRSSSEDQSQNMFAKSDGVEQNMSTGERVQMVQRLLDSAAYLATNGGGQIRLELPRTPWGSLDVAMNMINNKIDIRVIAGDEDIRESLVAEFKELSDILGSRKIEVGKIDIAVAASAQRSVESALDRSSQQGQSGGQNLQDHLTHREWLNDMRNQVKISKWLPSQRPIGSGLYEPKSLVADSSANLQIKT